MERNHSQNRCEYYLKYYLFKSKKISKSLRKSGCGMRSCRKPITKAKILQQEPKHMISKNISFVSNRSLNSIQKNLSYYHKTESKESLKYSNNYFIKGQCLHTPSKQLSLAISPIKLPSLKRVQQIVTQDLHSRPEYAEDALEIFNINSFFGFENNSKLKYFEKESGNDDSCLTNQESQTDEINSDNSFCKFEENSFYSKGDLSFQERSKIYSSYEKKLLEKLKNKRKLRLFSKIT